MVDQAVLEEERKKVKEAAKEAAERLRKKLSDPGAEMRYGGHSTTYETNPERLASKVGLPKDWALNLS